MAVFISESASGLPAGFVSMLRSVGVVHTAVVFLTVQRVRALFRMIRRSCIGRPCCPEYPGVQSDTQRQGVAWPKTLLRNEHGLGCR